MNVYVIFLRGINVSGKNILKMADFKKSIVELGYENVHTYIQSGNIVLRSKKSSQKVEKDLQTLLREQFSINTSIFVVTIDELIGVKENIPFKNAVEPNKLYIDFMNAKPTEQFLEKFLQEDFGEESIQFSNKIVYYYLPNGMATSKLTNNLIEKKLNINCTSRNYNTIEKMIAFGKQLGD